jgi:YjbE family integral membrane protein
MSVSSPEFWVALMQIIGINIVLSGDNAVVIALAARSLPARQQKMAVAWGSGAAVVMRIVLTIVAVELLRLPYLKLVGAALLLWIAIQLLLPEGEGEGHAETSGNLISAIKTILVADLVMSLDNVIAVAAAAKDSLTLLIIGLGISIPLVVFASTLLLKLMGRFPIIITIGAALLGWVAGEMAITDPVVKDIVDAQMAFLHYAAPALGALGVIVVGRFLAERAERAAVTAATVAEVPQPVVATLEPSAPQRILVAVDGSEHALRAAQYALDMRNRMRDPDRVELHVVNAQPPLPRDASAFVATESLQDYHKEQGEAAVGPARALLDAAGVPYKVHELVGEPPATIAALAARLGCALIVMGTRGLGAGAAALVGSVAQRTLEHSTVPVLLVR